MSSMHMLFAVSECEFVFVYVCFEILPDPCFMRRAMPARAMTAAAPNQLTPNVARRYVMLPPHRSFTTPTLFLCPPFSFMCGANPHHLQKQKKHPLSEWARTAGRTEGRTGTSLEISWQAARRVSGTSRREGRQQQQFDTISDATYSDRAGARRIHTCPNTLTPLTLLTLLTPPPTATSLPPPRNADT